MTNELFKTVTAIKYFASNSYTLTRNLFGCVCRGTCIKHIRSFPRRKRTVNRHANGVSKARQCIAEEETSENYWSYCCAFAVYCYCHGVKNNFSPIDPRTPSNHHSIAFVSVYIKKYLLNFVQLLLNYTSTCM